MKPEIKKGLKMYLILAINKKSYLKLKI